MVKTLILAAILAIVCATCMFHLGAIFGKMTTQDLQHLVCVSRAEGATLAWFDINGNKKHKMTREDIYEQYTYIFGCQ